MTLKTNWFHYARFIWRTSRTRDVDELTRKIKIVPGMMAMIHAEILDVKKKKKLLLRLSKMERAINIRLDKLVVGRETKRFDEIIVRIIKDGLHHRFARGIYGYYNKDIDEHKWIHFLEEKVRTGVMIRNTEICCPECIVTVHVFHGGERDISDDHELTCHNCGESFKLSDARSFVFYEVVT